MRHRPAAGTAFHRLPPRLLLFLCFGAPACAPLAYRDLPPFAKPPSEVLPAVVEALERERFTVTSSGPGLVEAVDVQLSAFAGEGVRRKATVRIEGGAEGTVVRLRVQRQVNSNIQAPHDERAADWSDAGTDEDAEELLLYRIREKLSPTVLPPTPAKRQGR